jgi:hypothetical protein
MTLLFKTVAALALSLAATAASADQSQLAASAGIEPAVAERLSLVEIAHIKFSADSRRDDRQTAARPVAYGTPAARSQLIVAAGLTPAEAEGMSLAELAGAKANREARGADRYVIVTPRGAETNTAGREQIAASIGVEPEVGRAMTLDQLAMAKYLRETNEN